MTVDEALRFFANRVTFSPRKDKFHLLALLADLGNPHEKLRCVHIAGTNGKGSVTTMTASVLRAAGFRVGAYLSPFVFDVCERWQLDGRPISPDQLAAVVSEIAPWVRKTAQEDPTAITEFELKTAVAFHLFAEAKVDYAVIETGIGGRLDSTNVIPPPEVAAITSIGYDHMNLLGTTLRQIATEKAGIIKRGTHACVTPVSNPEALGPITAKADAEDVPLLRVHGDELPEGVRLRLRGAHQRINASTTTRIARTLALPEAAIRRGLETASLPGRFQVCLGGRLILDGAHNAEGAAVLAETLRTEFPGETFTIVLGSKQTHEPDSLLSLLLPLARRVIATEPAFKPTPAAQVAAAAGDVPCEICVPVPAALEKALTYPERVVVTGSFYVVGETPEALRLP